MEKRPAITTASNEDSLVVRLDRDTCRRLAAMAQQTGKTVGQLAAEAVRMYATGQIESVSPLVLGTWGDPAQRKELAPQDIQEVMFDEEDKGDVEAFDIGEFVRYELTLDERAGRFTICVSGDIRHADLFADKIGSMRIRPDEVDAGLDSGRAKRIADDAPTGGGDAKCR